MSALVVYGLLMLILAIFFIPESEVWKKRKCSQRDVPVASDVVRDSSPPLSSCECRKREAE